MPAFLLASRKIGLRALRLQAAWVTAWGALATFSAWSMALAAATPDSRVLITKAEFRAAGAETSTPVELPDTWGLRGRAVAGLGHYQQRFTLSAAPAVVWALDVQRLSPSHEVRLNGQLVHGALQSPPPLQRALPTLITLPPHLLRAGDNTLDITVSAGASGGLSPLTLGPWDGLEADFRRRMLRTTVLPQMANMAAGGVALFMLLIWWRRRSETAIGSFGALCLLACMRNYSYFVNASPVPSPWSSWAFMQAAMLTTLLLGVFAMTLAERKPAWLRRPLGTTAVLFPLLTLWALSAGSLQTARLWLYPLLLLLTAMALGLMAQTAWQKRSVSTAVLLLGLIGVTLAGVHDYRFQQGRLPITNSFWLPYAVPAAVAAFAASLLKRLLNSLATVERMNVSLERKVLERTRELQAANAAQTRFLAAASHDLRQPMVSIGLLVGLMDEQVAPGPLRRVVQRLMEATGAMEGLLTRLLDLSRLQSGTVQVQRQPLPLQQLLTAVAAQHTEQAHSKGLRLRVHASRAVVNSDPVLLQQIVGNLVSNAVRYTRGGGVLLGVRPAGRAHWRVEVWDTGPGIAAEARHTIFGEFVRGTQHGDSEEAATGLGLGLAIVQRAATLLGAEVALRSQLGRGSCFSIVLPRDLATPTSVPEAASRPVPARPLAGRRIWLLEDDPNARASLHLLLQHWGAEVQTFASLQALRSADSEAPRPALLISDLRLPDGQGSDALLHLRKRWPEQRALFVTGNTAPDDLVALEHWREAGVPVLIKPFASTTLQSTVLAALAGG